jgi:uncharacterized protein (DUF302 family)
MTTVLIVSSKSDFAETRRALLAAIEKRGATVFAHIDHAAAAHEAGLELGPEEVVIFGNPQAGTALMQTDPRVGIELPLRVLLWEDADGVKLGYRDPRELVDRYSVAKHTSLLGTMGSMLASVVIEAAG